MKWRKKLVKYFVACFGPSTDARQLSIIQQGYVLFRIRQESG